jgi:hypothetical protein
MSNTTLNQLLEKHAFDGSPLHVDMPAFHVSFDDAQRTGTESGVVRAAESSERRAGPDRLRQDKAIALRLGRSSGTRNARAH